MHTVRRLPLRGDDLILEHIEPLTIGDELLGVVATAERLREPFAQATPVASLARMGQDHFLFASLQGPVEIFGDTHVLRDEGG